MTDTTKERLTGLVAALPDTDAVAALVYVNTDGQVAVVAPNMTVQTMDRLLLAATSEKGTTTWVRMAAASMPWPWLATPVLSLATLAAVLLK